MEDSSGSINYVETKSKDGVSVKILADRVCRTKKEFITAIGNAISNDKHAYYYKPPFFLRIRRTASSIIKHIRKQYESYRRWSLRNDEGIIFPPEFKICYLDPCGSVFTLYDLEEMSYTDIMIESNGSVINWKTFIADEKDGKIYAIEYGVIY